ncbi:hypothetical protein PPL_02634 [Heterostelium album PN500]|uniref:B box-type domain-containing protein n=1 Tax=Heterostelium pallidum (strain ATCC 26659 / Pp 5 / PN500) TaxID=670386 RepID=D3B2M0_HETP5|nr:hypothetical protein PPL_02634 [Heterostelium album PN500]EFA83568.1 hypothetical protein PPL_02634 [Heterostelium album PN500]|eukprot:XP_020435685.1 hypothetical protein PPL_02634 [Heterostelium album PN500]
MLFIVFTDMKGDSNFICPEHKRQLEFICFKCNILLCSKCSNNHNKKFVDHSPFCDHVDDIKNSLETVISTGSASESGSESSSIKNRLSSIWTTIKSQATRHHSLESTESEISAQFSQFHEYLIVEEHKLKKSIVTQKDLIKEQIDINVNQLKSLVDIANTWKHIEKKGDGSEDDSLVVGSEDSNTDSTAESYSLSSIMESINQSNSLCNFINRNSNTLFDYIVPESTDENRDVDLVVLDMIYKYNQQYSLKSTSATPNNNNNNGNMKYELIVSSEKVEQVKLSIQQSFNLISQRIKQNYIFSIFDCDSASLINISDQSYSTESSFQLKDYESGSTYNSMVQAGDHIYIFGSNKPDISNKYCRISIKSKSIDHIGEMKGIKGGQEISVCYDGADHIYLINGYDSENDIYHHRVDRFNIKSMKFESQLNFDCLYTDYYSFFFNGTLYTVPYQGGLLYAINPITRAIDKYKSDQILDEISAMCHDRYGNIFMHSLDGRFIRFNVVSKDIEELETSIELEVKISMIYHHISSKEGLIYLLGGCNYDNHIYNIETNEWTTFDDDKDRDFCGASIITM